MLAARMHGYKQPLVLDEIKTPEISPDQVLVRVGGCGMCRSDVQLIDGWFPEALIRSFPITPGHEIAGLVEANRRSRARNGSTGCRRSDGCRCRLG